MDAREELAKTVRPVLADYGAMGTVPPEHPLGLPGWGDRLSADESDCPESIADALLAAGYRKMPDREAVIRVLAENGLDADGREPHSWRCSDKERYPGDCTCPAEIAEDIRALMDGTK